MDYKIGDTWVFLTPESTEKGVVVHVKVGRGTMMDDGTEKGRAKWTAGTVGPFADEAQAVAAAREYAGQWIREHPGYR